MNTTRLKKIATGIAIGAIAGWLTDQYLQWEYRGRNTADELHRFRTSDDVGIALLRYRSSEPSAQPVLLVHGLGVNQFHMDLDERLSLARYLRDQGYDAWCVVMRGRTISETPDYWTFDDYAKRDIPAAIDHILDETAHSQLHWVGHSMGGMLFYAVAGAVDYDHAIRSAVSIGGPFHGKRADDEGDHASNYPFGFGASGYTGLFAPVLEVLRRLRVPWPVMARWGALTYPGLRPMVPNQLIQIMANPKNIQNDVLRKSAVRCVERVSAGVLAQFIDWGMNRYWSDLEGTLNYREAVSDIDVPTRLIAGSADNMVPVHNQKAGFDQLATEDKDLVIAGKEHGFSEDYSHVDLVYGPKARDEIFPLVVDWLNKF